MEATTATRNPQGLQLNPDIYRVGEKEAQFLKEWTKIEQDEELKTHVLQVQREAWEV